MRPYPCQELPAREGVEALDVDPYRPGHTAGVTDSPILTAAPGLDSACLSPLIVSCERVIVLEIRVRV
jgi:hypothetical protein